MEESMFGMILKKKISDNSTFIILNLLANLKKHLIVLFCFTFNGCYAIINIERFMEGLYGKSRNDVQSVRMFTTCF